MSERIIHVVHVVDAYEILQGHNSTPPFLIMIGGESVILEKVLDRHHLLVSPAPVTGYLNEWFNCPGGCMYGTVVCGRQEANGSPCSGCEKCEGGLVDCPVCDGHGHVDHE